MGLAILVAALGIFIWQFISDSLIPGWSYVVLLALVEGWIVVSRFIDGKRTILIDQDPYFFTELEAMLLKKYWFFFAAPFTAKGLSSAMSGIAFSTLIWAPLLFYKGNFIAGVLIAVNFLLANKLGHLLNPIGYLHYVVNANKQPELVDHMYAVDSLAEKLLGSKP